MVKPSFLPKLEHFVAKFGTLPSSYKEAMTYEEQILWICNYLKSEIMPVIQNNAEALEELQGLFVALKDYVDDYFDNLDITTEIDNKLDEMADNGTLAEIIEDYATIPQLTERVTAVEEEIETMQEKEKYIFVSDSYGAAQNSWIDKIIALIGEKADCEKVAIAGAGFVHLSQSGYTFLTYLDSLEDQITDKDRVTKIIVAGGYNDSDATYSEITTAITSFCDYCATTYEKAKVYIACIGFNTALTTAGDNVRENLKNIVIPAYSATYHIANEPSYINNADKILQADALIGNDNIHPTNLGQQYIADRLYTFILTGTPITNNKPEKTCNLTYNSVNYALRYLKDDEKLILQSNAPLIINSFPASTNFVSFGYLDISNSNFIGDIDCNDIYPSNRYQWFYRTSCAINCDEGRFRNVPCTVWFRYNRKLYISINLVNDQGQLQNFTNVTYLSIYNNLNFEKGL